MAHEVARAHLDDTEPSRDVDPRLAACACLRSDDPELQGDGAALLAALADEDVQSAQAALYDLAAVLDADDQRTRAHAMGAFQVAASTLPKTAVDLLDAVVPRLVDVDPLVREAAASTVAWLAEAVRDDTRSGFPDGTRAAFEPAIDPLLAVLDAANGDGRFEWRTQFAVVHPTRTFWGEVDAGVSRRSENQWQAAFAVALLADWFPDRVAAHADLLAELADAGERTETRWYAIDALARTGADDALRAVRDRARDALDDPDRAPAGVETLYHFVTERPVMLVPAASDLAAVIDDLDADSTALAAVTILHAAVHHRDIDETALPVRDLVYEWLQESDDGGPRSIPVGSGLIADLAIAHPGCVFPAVSQVLDVPLAAHAIAENGASSTRSTSATELWDEDRAWRLLREIAKQDRELLWDVLEPEWLRDMLDRRDDRAGQVRRLYARIVPTPPPESAVGALFESVLADGAGARGALSTLQDRAPDAVCTAAVGVLEDAPAPSKDALAVLESLSDTAPRALAPLMEALWSWNDAIQPTDDRWTDLVTVLGRVAVATDDSDRLSRMLHLEHTTYCKRFLETAVAPAVIRAAPHKSIPALLDHLDDSNPLLRQQIIHLFEAPPDEYEGWEPAIRDGIIDSAADSNRSVRTVAVRTLGTWLEALTRQPDDDHSDWSTPVRSALLDCLSDDDWRVRAHAVRALTSDTDSKTRMRLEDRLACENDQTVRFEIQRVLHGLDQRTSSDC